MIKPAHNDQQRLIDAIVCGDDNHGFDPQGIAIYRKNLIASAERALSITFPTVKKMIGASLFLFASRKLLTTSPPNMGDWALWGDNFPSLLASVEQLATYPFVVECAHIDLLRHQSERTNNIDVNLASLQLLATDDLDNIYVEFTDFTHVRTSKLPIVELWQAHGNDESLQEIQLVKAQQWLASNNNVQYLLLYRPQYKTHIRELSFEEHQWLTALAQGLSIGHALETINLANFAFEQWLPLAIEQKLFSHFTTSPVIGNNKILLT
jgi:hypothetical protein